MTTALERNCREFGIQLWAPGAAGSEHQGIVHVIGPELGLTQPGMTIACGDSHTSTHGALGAIAFGIGTSQVRDVLASQCLALDPLKVRRIDVNGQLRARRLREGRDPDDHPPARRPRRRRATRTSTAARRIDRDDDRRADDHLQHVDRRRRARRLRQPGRDDVRVSSRAGGSCLPGAAFDRAVAWWRQIASDPDADYDDRVVIDAASIEPTVTWGINPGQSVGIGEPIAADADEEALAFMGFERGRRVEGTRIDVAFIGSCTNGRLSDLEEAARIVRAGAWRRTSRRSSCPGSQAVSRAAEAKGLPRDLHERRLRVARRRLLDVPGDEPRPARGPSDLRVVVEPELQGPPGQPDRPHAAHEPGDGGRRRPRRRSRRRAGTCSKKCRPRPHVCASPR